MSELEKEIQLLTILKEAVLSEDYNTLKSIEPRRIIALTTLCDDAVRRIITNTFKDILTSGKPVRKPFLIASWLIEQIIPELKETVGFDQNSKYHQHTVYEHMLCVTDACDTNKFEIKLAALFHDIGKPVAAVLGGDGYTHYHGHPAVSHKICRNMFPRIFSLTEREYERVLKLIDLHDAALIGEEKQVKRFIARYGKDFFEDWLILKNADISDHINLKFGIHCPDIQKIKEVYNKILNDEKRFKINDLAVNGDDLIEIGIPEGKEIGKMLDLLFCKVEKGLLPNLKHILLMYCSSLMFEANPLGEVKKVV